ncbi:MAG: ABC transporter permease [Chloroflexi bacterium]|nr:ABC transporter permease [Chloroflexota bacterium]
MKKAWIIARKDLMIRFRDGWGVLFLILTPLALTTIMGLAFGGITDNQAELHIPVAIVNRDRGLQSADLENGTAFKLPAALLATGRFTATTEATQTGFPAAGLNFGQVMIEQVFASAGLQTLLQTTVVTDESAARRAVAAGTTYCCVITFPPTLTQALVMGQPLVIPLYSDPARATSAQIVESVLKQVVGQLGGGSALFQISLAQLASSGRLDQIQSSDQLTALFTQIGNQLGVTNTSTTTLGANNSGETGAFTGNSLLQLVTRDVTGTEVAFNILAFFVPAMALIFLGFGASQGVRSILVEEEMGTFARLNAGPLSSGAILLGKLIGVFVICALQFGVLLLAGRFLFQVQWGDPLAVALLAIVTVLAFTGLGLLIATVARDQSQANTLATTINLIFSLVGGSLIPMDRFPAWLQRIAQLTPNYWGMAGFTKLAIGQGLPALTTEISALTIISVFLFGVGLLLYRRRVLR